MEEWRDIKGYEGFYQVSNLGRIKSLKRKITTDKGTRMIYEKHLSLVKSSRGYLTVRLSKLGYKKTFNVHQIVAVNFLNHTPNGMSTIVDHENGIKTDNRLDNLQLITQRKNVIKGNFSNEYRGASWCKNNNNWRSVVQINGKKKELGRFSSAKEASEAYHNAIKLL